MSLGELHVPVFHSAELRHFSLYSGKKRLSCNFPPGVFCLLGANGLGKSTFLTSLAYAVTGIVPEPGRKFESVREFHTNCLGFAKKYFTGRIREKDRAAAEIEVDFSLGATRILVVRGLFDSGDIRKLKVTRNGKEADFQDLDVADRLQTFQRAVTESAGVALFEQFSFLQHFILTFDERRHLLFWDDKVLEQALYLAFRVDPSEAERADSARRAAEKADSLVRNLQWQATELQNRVEELEPEGSSKDDDNDVDIEAEYKVLEADVDSKRTATESTAAELQSARLRLGELQSQLAKLRDLYEEEFRRHLRRAGPRRHPVVIESLTEGVCGFCGSDAHLPELKRRAENSPCALCGAALNAQSAKGPSLASLSKTDATINSIYQEVEESGKRVARLQKEDNVGLSAWEGARRKLDLFERKHKVALARLEPGQDTLETLLQGYRREIEDLQRRKDEQYAIRTQKRKDWKELQKPLEASYQAAEKTFVPRFRDLAHSFIGLDLDISLQTKRNVPGATLVLEVRGSERRDEHQLSESQRFFLDIALRMALIMQIAPSKAACIFLDTPEGSLDIAYEARAGDMLAKFVKEGFQVLMTANINTSRLALRLASQAKKERMHLERMTSWTELSEVQRAALPEFEAAYNALNNALSGEATK
jgi:DNA repair exonuclease SbcCD ATPase subunit